MRSARPLCAPPHLIEVSPVLPLKESQSCYELTMSRSLKADCQPLPFFRPPLGDRYVLGFVPTGCVLSSSPLQIFKYTSHLWCLFFPPVYLLGHFPRLQLVQDCSSLKGVSWEWMPNIVTCQWWLPIPFFHTITFEDAYWTLSHASCDFLFHFSCYHFFAQ